MPIFVQNLAIGPIPTFYNRIKQGKECFISDAYRDFLDFDDFYNLLVRVIKSKINQNKVFNVSTGISTHISEIFNIVKNILKKIIFLLQLNQLIQMIFLTQRWTPH